MWTASAAGPFPRLRPMHQRLFRQPLDGPAVAAAVRRALGGVDLSARIRPGARVAIPCGSRGIAQLPAIMRAVVDHVRSLGGEPFIFPAMGSHGGATADGQARVLATLGVTAATMGCPIHSSMEVVELGTTADGLKVYLDRHAASADAIVVVNRVKPHTNFRGDWESGLVKMLAIGMGKHAQAIAIHRYGVIGLRDYMPAVAQLLLERAPVVAGLAILEDAGHAVCEVAAMPAGQMMAVEKDLLRRVRAWQPALPLPDLDLLIVDQIGKDLSGTGLDTNVIGRVRLVDNLAFAEPRIRLLIALDLSPGTHGNATGIGLADLVTQRLVDRVDWAATYTNCITGLGPQQAARPVTLRDDREALWVGLQYLVAHKPVDELRIVRIRDTLSLEWLYVSPAVHAATAGREGFEFPGGEEEMAFTAEGRLARGWAEDGRCA